MGLFLELINLLKFPLQKPKRAAPDAQDVLYSVDEWNLTSKARIERKLFGSYGGYSEVFRGTMRIGWGPKVEVGIKVLRLRNRITDDERLQKRFFREVRTWSRLKHPNVVRLCGFTLPSGIDGHPTILSPWCKNGNVVYYLKQNMNADRLSILRGAILGLQYLHSQSVVHADIKGENVLIDDSGNALLCDFGQSHLTNNSPGNITASLLTPSMGVAGTLRFLSPEVLQDEAKSTMSDMWAFGCLVLQIWTGLVPYPHIQADHALFRSASHNAPFDVAAFLPQDLLESELLDYTSRCWRMKPNERPTAIQFSSEVDALTRQGLKLVRRLKPSICRSVTSDSSG